MGFKTVYQCLHDLFPQVDYRILRAVAIEHSKDADTAAEVVLLEILPNLGTSAIVSAMSNNTEINLLNGQIDQEEEQPQLIRNKRSMGETSGFSLDTKPTSAEQSLEDPTCQPPHSIDLFLKSKVNARDCGNTVTEEKPVETNVLPKEDHHSEVFLGASGTQANADTSLKPSRTLELVGDIENDSDHKNEGSSDLMSQENCSLETVKINLNAEGNRESLLKSPAELSSSDLSEHMQSNELGKSSQENKITVLEEMIDDAKSNKKNLFAAMESVLNMMQEVEKMEKAAVLAKEEAETGGIEILDQVENLNKIIPQAKEANNMHAGEVYGEKAILATELRELQSRLLNLADDRDGALAVLDEMSQSLQDRLSAADEMRKAAELEKLEKEKDARRALADIESIMQEVVNESQMLQSESEENSKLREFLMDRGRIVDTLQGEISVICLDVKLLKEKFDDRVPLSKSITSNQTSCILASSGSASFRNTQSNSVLDVGENFMNSKSGSSASCDYDIQSPKAPAEDERIIKCDKVALTDDEWELFDSAEIAS